ncbi:hypothetical protein N9W95_03270, partial [Paracoccaceae bacterium]|nr:hypothetical protein [Paracoccaceae bacterium]
GIAHGSHHHFGTGAVAGLKLMALSLTPLHNWYRINAIPEKVDVAGLSSWICFKRCSKNQLCLCR